jgi:chaperonin GroEL (HSP60 family)
VRESALRKERGRIDLSRECVVAEMKRFSKPTTTSKEIAQIGSISANGDADISEIIAKAIDKVGKEEGVEDLTILPAANLRVTK